jgi:hypothetical protein
VNVQRIQNSELIVGWIRNELARFGFNVKYYPKIQTEEDEVYGIYSGVNLVDEVNSSNIRVLMPRQLWAVVDDTFVSGFESVNLFTSNTIQNGDVIEIIRTDNTVFRFKIVEVESIGFEKKVVTRFHVTPLGD